MKKSIVILLSALLLVGCQHTGGTKQTAGTAIGGVSGALLGAQFGHGRGTVVAAVVGALAGAYLGGAIGHQMDERDQLLANKTLRNTLENAPDHTPSRWKNPNTQNAGRVVVTKTVEKPQSQQVCRDYVHTVTIGGEKEKVYGRACRDLRDVKGEWIIQQ